MLGTLRSRLTYANVMSTIAVFVAVGTGGAYAANTVFSTDIVDGEVKSVDIGNNEIGSSDVKDNSINTFDVHSFLGVDVVDETLTGADVGDGTLTGADVATASLTGTDVQVGSLDGTDIGDGSLKDEDVAEGAFVNVIAAIGVVPAQSCEKKEVTGINATGDHLLLTVESTSANDDLVYSAEEWRAFNPGSAIVKICNPTTADIDDGSTTINLLVINAN